MSWQTLRGRRYFVLTREVDGKRIRKWMGTGERAKQAEQAHLKARQETEDRQRQARDHDILVEQYATDFKSLANEILEPYGCIRDGGRWRKPLQGLTNSRINLPHATEGVASENTQETKSKTRVELDEGEKSPQAMRRDEILALGQQIRAQSLESLNHDPKLKKLAETATNELIESLQNECYARHNLSPNSKLPTPNSLKLELLLVDQIATHHLDSYVRDTQMLDFPHYEYARQKSKFWNRYTERAHVRLTMSMRRLVMVQQMNLPQ